MLRKTTLPSQSRVTRWGTHRLPSAARVSAQLSFTLESQARISAELAEIVPSNSRIWGTVLTTHETRARLWEQFNRTFPSNVRVWDLGTVILSSQSRVWDENQGIEGSIGIRGLGHISLADRELNVRDKVLVAGARARIMATQAVVLTSQTRVVPALVYSSSARVFDILRQVVPSTARVFVPSQSTWTSRASIYDLEPRVAIGQFPTVLLDGTATKV